MLVQREFNQHKKSNRNYIDINNLEFDISVTEPAGGVIRAPNLTDYLDIEFINS